MGQIILPDRGTVYVDANILIYSVERHPRYWPLLESMWKRLNSESLVAVTSELSILETLVAPLRARDQRLEQAFRDALESREMRLIPVSRDILVKAAQLRSSMPVLRSPDAIHAATALFAQSAVFLTNDRRMKSVSHLSCTIIDDVI